MRNTNKAFTLVELIVVITILAILATIAFISLSGYSADSKNAKVKADLRTMVSAIETGLTKGSFTLPGIVTADTNYNVGNAATTTITYATGSTTATGTLTGGAADITTYTVGTLDFAAIGQNGDDFKDPEGNPYLAAVASQNSTAYYQLAGQIKNSATDTYESVVKGNYVAQSNGTDAAGLIGDRTGDDQANGVANNVTLGESLYVD